MKTLKPLPTCALLYLLFGWASPSSAQIVWVEHPGNPVIESSSGTWDSGIVLAPTVIADGDTLRMWYTGATSITDPSGISIGYATSLDGINWTKYAGNPVLEGRDTDWDKPGVLMPIVLQDADTLRMWYGAGTSPDDAKIGYAKSVDGISWTRHSSPVLLAGTRNEWHADAVMPGTVIKEGGVFKMWFSGARGPINGADITTETAVGYATSPDGINWTLYDDPATPDAPYKFSDPVLNHGDSSEGDWDANEMFTPSVVKLDSEYILFYSGWRFGGDGQHIGFATSPDGINWTKYEQNPVFSEPKTWNGGHVFPSVIWDDGMYRMWYQGWQGGTSAAIGYATSLMLIYPGTEDPSHGGRFARLFQNYPNPFEHSTALEFELELSAVTSLRVYDLLGREVRELTNGFAIEGSHEYTWDGRNQSGELQAGGLYFAILETSGTRRTVVLSLIR